MSEKVDVSIESLENLKVDLSNLGNNYQLFFQKVIEFNKKIDSYSEIFDEKKKNSYSIYLNDKEIFLNNMRGFESSYEAKIVKSSELDYNRALKIYDDFNEIYNDYNTNQKPIVDALEEKIEEYNQIKKKGIEFLEKYIRLLLKPSIDTLPNKGDNSLSSSKNIRDTVAILKNVQRNSEKDFLNHAVIAGSQNRKLRVPNGGERGFWNKNKFVLNDDFVPKSHNSENKTFAEIKIELLNEYNINCNSIEFNNSFADFSKISICNISTKDILLRAANLTDEQFDSKPNIEQLHLYNTVFNPSKNKDNRDFNASIADKIAAQRQVHIPKLGSNYTYKQLETWRKTHGFTWDEQVYTGYSLVPSVIHGNIAHTGVVSIAGNAYNFINDRMTAIKDSAKDFCSSEKDSIISFSELSTND